MWYTGHVCRISLNIPSGRLITDLVVGQFIAHFGWVYVFGGGNRSRFPWHSNRRLPRPLTPYPPSHRRRIPLSPPPPMRLLRLPRRPPPPRQLPPRTSRSFCPRGTLFLYVSIFFYLNFTSSFSVRALILPGHHGFAREC